MKIKKSLSLLLLTVLGLISLYADTPEEFLATYRKALEQKDAAKLLSFYYTEGCSEADLNSLKEMLPMMAFYNGQLKDVKLEPLSKDVALVHILNGKKYELAYPAEGQIKFYYESQQTNGTAQYQGGDVYAVINGIHRLIAMKSSDLGWKGPKDQQIIYNVMGKGQDKCEVQYQWNTSGVDQEQTSHSQNCGMPGQYFKYIKVTSNEDDTDVTLSVREGGKEIYLSQPLKGKGTIEYKRGQ